MRITVDGTLGPGVTAKDMALGWIAELGADGARGHAVEYAGSAVRGLSMEGRMTLCNLSIEGGARFGMIAPDETTFAYLEGRRFAPKGAAWDAAGRRTGAGSPATRTRPSTARWRSTPREIAPIVTWGTSPEEALADQRRRSPTLPAPTPRKARRHRRRRSTTWG